jgi:hypothetical protein
VGRPPSDDSYLRLAGLFPLYGLQSGPGHTQHCTPPFEEHVPERFCDMLNCPLLQTAVTPGGVEKLQIGIPPGLELPTVTVTVRSLLPLLFVAVSR